MPKGVLVVSDLVVQYLEELAEGEVPKKIVVATESSALRALHPTVASKSIAQHVQTMISPASDKKETISQYANLYLL
jgi:hypothetical protein